MLSLNCKNVQHVKIYLPCNFEVNSITYFGVIALFHQIFKSLILFVLYFKNYEIDVKFKLQKCSACQDLQKSSTVENIRQLCEELFLLKCIFFVTQIIKGKQLYYKM